jgi:hypothetical protein
MAADMDIWEVAGEDAKRDFDEALRKADSAASPRDARAGAPCRARRA